MAYSADSFSPGEQPTTAKWNKLWTNDASFNDGTGIGSATLGPAKFIFSGCSVKRTTAQTISNATYTAILYDAELWDTDSYHSTSGNTSRMTAPATGYYRLTYTLGWVNGTTGERGSWMAVNGSGGAGQQRYGADERAAGGTAGASAARTGSVDLNLTLADYVEVFVYQDSTANVDTTSEATQAGYNRFSIQRLA